MSGSEASEEELMAEESGKQGSGEEEKVFLVQEKDVENYSFRKFAKACSFKLGVIISFVVFILIFAAVTTVVTVLLTSLSSSSKSVSRVLQLEDIFNERFKYKTFSGKWTDDNKLLEASATNGLILFDPSNQTSDILITSSMWAELESEIGSIGSVELSHDRKLVLFGANIDSVYRHSSVGDYFLYNLSSHNVSNLTLPSNSTERIQLAQWNPTQDVIAYVLDYDIYFYDVMNEELVAVTTNGEKNSIYNGIADWVYEEEILSTDLAMWWAPNGERLLFACFNDSAVERYQFPLYGSYLDPDETEYTTIDTIAYPKPGTPIPLVSLLVVDLPLSPSPPSSLLPPRTGFISSEHYFVSAGWYNSTVAMVTWTNRSSNSAVYCLYPEGTSECDLIYITITNNGWIENVEPPTVVKDGGILAVAPKPEGYNRFLHIIEMDPTGNSFWRTSGFYEVTSIIGATQSDLLYLSAETSPSQRHLYSAKTKSCLTCSQTHWNVPKSTNPSIPSRCDYFFSSCSPSLQYCLLQCLGPAVPYTLLATYDGESLKPVMLLEDNYDLLEMIKTISLPTTDVFKVPSTAGDPDLNGQIMFPPGFKPTNRYPVLFYVYGGPYSQIVSNRTILQSLSLIYLCSNLSAIVISVDGRGTGFRGDNFKFAVYHNLGFFETIDQIRAGRYIQELKYVEDSKIAIYGVSYGGYMAGMVGSNWSKVFSAAISQSPVTDWHYYDSAYTERYMDQPAYNPHGYKESSLLGRADRLSDIDYLLIHGTGDDNVHFQHTAQLVQALTEQEVQFRLQIYTDKTHSLSGIHTRTHLYTLIAGFLSESFNNK